MLKPQISQFFINFTSVKFLTQILFLTIATTSLSFTSPNDRGGKKGAKKVILNVSNTVAKKNSIFSQNFTAVKYKGLSFGDASNNNLQIKATTYQKGNTVYIQPTKQRVLVPEFKQGYGGLKLIINVL